MRLFHTTAAAAAILRDGFRDSTGGYGFAELELTGIWLGDSPMTANEGAKGAQVLAVEIDEELLANYEVIEDGKPYREWCAPADLVNGSATGVTLLTQDEVDEISWNGG
jgi:hypothetical protein